MKLLNKITVVLGTLLAMQAHAVGIDSKKLVLPCEGTITMKEVIDHGKTNGNTDRGGNHHPATGYAYIRSEVTALSASCEIFQNKLGLVLNEKTFKHPFFFKETDLSTVLSLAKSELGKEYNFTAKQVFSYIDKNGYLPFFPLIHEESVVLDATSISIPGSTFAVDTKKAYGINLSEEEKTELSQLIFQYLDQGDLNGIWAPALFDATLENHPQFEKNFKVFLSEILEYYQVFEEQYDAKTYSGAAPIVTSLASGIRKLTYKHPQIYAFKMPSLLVNHPSLVNYSAYKAEKKECLNISAAQFDDALGLLSLNLANNSIHPNVKKNWKDILKVASGGLWRSALSHCMEKITSNLAQKIALELLHKYY